MKEVNVTNYYYVPGGPTIKRQGKERDMKKHLKEGYEIVYKNNGYFVLAIPSVAMVEYEVNGISNSECVKPLIREYFNTPKVTEDLFDKFMDEYENNKFDFGYSGRLYLKNN